MMRINVMTSKKSFIISCVFIVLLSFTSSYSYYEDFEASGGGFIPEPPTGGWEWGVPISGPNNPHSGTKVWATALNGNYTNNANWTLTSPAFISSGTNPQFKFWHWYQIENIWDGGNVKISTNNCTTWQVIYPVGGYPTPGGQCYYGSNPNWTEAVFNLPVVSGQTFFLRFHFWSDS